MQTCELINKVGDHAHGILCGRSAGFRPDPKGDGLIEQLSTEEFHPDKFKDEYRLRVLSVLEKKAKTGEEITEAPHPVRQPGRVIDLMEALKKSLGSGPAGEKPAARKKRRAR